MISLLSTAKLLIFCPREEFVFERFDFAYIIWQLQAKQAHGGKAGIQLRHSSEFVRLLLATEVGKIAT